ncbi:MAG: TIGR03560 family F420-dependent LLM class oxidoreductase [Dehalococcoidia bacterium]|nr:TIGR03560 family F420-dependent LLM class oxidoreductase [Dehalococcoidia bacterium]
MRFSFWPGPQNSFEETLALARHAESTGWDGVWYADHFMPNANDTSGPTSECFTTLAALAAAVPRIRLGSLVAGNTYRHPAILAKMAATIDQVSGGRMVLGLGSGWQENEHLAYGIPFHTVGGRLRRLEEACRIITSLLENEVTTFKGRFYEVHHAPLEPKPVQRPLPLLIGGGGEQLTLRIAASYANEWNTWGLPAHLHQKMAVLDRHCSDLNRDPKLIHRSANALLLFSDDPSVLERARASGRPVIGGTIGQVQETVRDYIESGVGELIIPDFNLGTDVEQKKAVMDRFMQDVARALQ